MTNRTFFDQGIRLTISKTGDLCYQMQKSLKQIRDQINRDFNFFASNVQRKLAFRLNFNQKLLVLGIYLLLLSCQFSNLASTSNGLGLNSTKPPDNTKYAVVAKEAYWVDVTLTPTPTSRLTGSPTRPKPSATETVTPTPRLTGSPTRPKPSASRTEIPKPSVTPTVTLTRTPTVDEQMFRKDCAEGQITGCRVLRIGEKVVYVIQPGWNMFALDGSSVFGTTGPGEACPPVSRLNVKGPDDNYVVSLGDEQTEPLGTRSLCGIPTR